MRHRVAHRKLGRVTPHRTALLRNLASALFEQERIRTTLMKAKELRPFAERLITLAKREDDRLHARRLVLRDIQDPVLVKKLFDSLGARYATRPGGYTRILRLGPAPRGRRGDGDRRAPGLGVQAQGQGREGQEEGRRGRKAKAEAKPEAKPKSEEEGQGQGEGRRVTHRPDRAVCPCISRSVRTELASPRPSRPCPDLNRPLKRLRPDGVV